MQRREEGREPHAAPLSTHMYHAPNAQREREGERGTTLVMAGWLPNRGDHWHFDTTGDDASYGILRAVSESLLIARRASGKASIRRAMLIASKREGGLLTHLPNTEGALF